MTERIPEEKIIEIRQAVDIVDVISEYVQLKKQGRNYFGLCPFHGESTPSFSVSTDKQIFHCFGCGAGGNVFTFLMDLEGYSFLETVAQLAERVNIPLNVKITDKETTAIPTEHQKMIEAHELLRKFYHHLLVNTKDGQHALEYLLHRGFTEESIEKFQIGYSLNSWDFTVKFLSKRGFSLSLMESAGLLIKKDQEEQYFDRFRNRIMFPILDSKGNTIAFSGRALGDDEPKYLNSPETVLFNKSKTLFNLHLARSTIRKKHQIILFEGFADVISADMAGVENGIATMGTSLTNEHVSIIKRLSDQVVICYDSDNAGIEATYRAANMLIDSGFSISIAKLPDGYDPDDYIREYGSEKFQAEIIDSTITLMSFKMQYYRRGKNLNHEGDRLQYIESVLEEIANLDKVVERDHYLRQISNEFSLSLDALEQQQKQIYFAKKRVKQQDSIQQPKNTIIKLQPSKSLKPAYFNAERMLIAHMLRNHEVAYKVFHLLNGNNLNVDDHQAIITYLFAYYEDGRDSDPVAFLNYIQDEKLRRIVVDIEMMSINEEYTENELNDYIKQVLNHQKMLKINEKEHDKTEAERQHDFLKAAVIAQEILMLKKSL